ncbi:hypothetical protein NCCP691_11200 [Noviherbaspirillum aridicola]|uniref:Antitoxin ParD1/3/4 n=1 Tax=Noviherbaspirillum aridicola TaxID=2849687 RepID=A0ABQ4Q1P6_9BURK|nr:hypothetical protein NCCP691_11200 [Noviherbaspirillum aridicola]
MTRTHCAYGSKSDATKTFARMLKSGNPSNDWDELLAEVTAQTQRQEQVVERGGSL